MSRKSVEVTHRRDLPERPGDMPCANQITAEIKLFYPEGANYFDVYGALLDAYERVMAELEEAIPAQAVAV